MEKMKHISATASPNFLVHGRPKKRKLLSSSVKALSLKSELDTQPTRTKCQKRLQEERLILKKCFQIKDINK